MGKIIIIFLMGIFTLSFLGCSQKATLTAKKSTEVVLKKVSEKTLTEEQKKFNSAVIFTYFDGYNYYTK